jgi:hypothetical protein
LAAAQPVQDVSSDAAVDARVDGAIDATHELPPEPPREAVSDYHAYAAMSLQIAYPTSYDTTMRVFEDSLEGTKLLGRAAAGVWLRQFSPDRSRSLGLRVGLTAYVGGIRYAKAGVGIEVAGERLLADRVRLGVRTSLETSPDASAILSLGLRLYVTDGMFFAADGFTILGPSGTVCESFEPGTAGVLIGAGFAFWSNTPRRSTLPARPATVEEPACPYKAAYADAIERQRAAMTAACAGKRDPGCFTTPPLMRKLLDRRDACLRDKSIGPPEEVE